MSINEDGSGFINWDNDYDTDYVKSISDCEQWELVEMVKEETLHGFKRYELEQIWGNLTEIAQDNRYYDLLDEMGVEA